MKTIYLILIMLAIVLTAIFCLLTTGCISVREVTMKKAVVTPHIEQLELSGRIGGEPVTFTGKAVIKSRETAGIPVRDGVNYRRADGIRQVWGHLFALLKVWFWDLLIVALLICLLTEVGGRYLRPAGVKIPKIVLSVLTGGLIGIFYLIFLSVDWVYAVCLCVSSIVIANVGWEYLVNKAGKSLRLIRV